MRRAFFCLAYTAFLLAAHCADTAPGCQSCGMNVGVTRAARKGATTVVSESENTFSGKNITIQLGDTVTWTNIGVEDHTATSDNGLWDSGRMKPGQSFSHTFKTPGFYPYNCVYHKAMGMKGTITVNPAAPAITGPLTAIGAVGAIFSYSIEAATADIFAAEALPPGLFLSGNTITGVPTEPYVYVVHITAGNVGGSETQSLLIEIVNTIAESDQDADGFSDALETAAGSSPADAASTPLGIPSGAAVPLRSAKLSIKLNFARPGSDTLAVSGTLLVPDNFAPAGKQIAVDIGGVSQLFMLDENGLAKSGAGSFKLNINSSQGIVAAQNAPFAIKLEKGAYAGILAGIGLNGSANLSKALKTVRVTVLFNGLRYERLHIVTYTARVNKSGMAK